MHCCPSSAAAATLPAAQRLQTFHSAHQSWVCDSEHSSQQQTLISDTRHWAGSAAASELFTGSRTIPYLKPAEGVFLRELHRRDVVVEVPLPRPPEGLQLVPFCQNSVSLISQEGGSREGAGCVDELVRLGGCLGGLAEQAAS